MWLGCDDAKPEESFSSGFSGFAFSVAPAWLSFVTGAHGSSIPSTFFGGDFKLKLVGKVLFKDLTLVQVIPASSGMSDQQELGRFIL